MPLNKVEDGQSKICEWLYGEKITVTFDFQSRIEDASSQRQTAL